MIDMNFLIKFRELYLRIIARAWAEPAFKDELLGQAPEQMQGFLNDAFGAYEGLLAQLDLDFEQTGSEVEQGHWDAISAGWVGSKIGDRIEVKLPLRPRLLAYEPGGAREKPYWQLVSDEDIEQYASQALADFYPSESETVGGSQSYGSRAIANPALGSPTPFLELGGYMLDALALGWSPEGTAFRQEVDIEHENLQGGKIVNFGKSEQALTRWLGYVNPLSIWVVVRDVANAVWIQNAPTSAKEVGLVGVWRIVGDKLDPSKQYSLSEVFSWMAVKLPKTKLVLQLPAMPSRDDISLPVALAAYNQTGPGYPFTCPG